MCSNLSALIPTILCYSGESDHWQSLARAVSLYASLLLDSSIVIECEFELGLMKWINFEVLKRPNTAITALDDVGIFFIKHQHLTPDPGLFAELNCSG